MPDQQAPRGDPVADRVSAAVSRLYLDKFGKGPLSAETFMNGDIVVTVLRDVYTVAEKAMFADGREESVLTTRVLWQHTTDDQFKAAVANATGRGVLAAISGFEIREEMATEVFVLAPR